MKHTEMTQEHQRAVRILMENDKKTKNNHGNYVKAQENYGNLRTTKPTYGDKLESVDNLSKRMGTQEIRWNNNIHCCQQDTQWN